jgi:hypothetical protein
MVWNLEHRAFVMRRYYANGESVLRTQREFRREFSVPRHGPIPTRNTIMRWITSVNTTGSLFKKKPPGPTRTVRTPENVDRMRVEVLHSPKRSIRKRAAALHMSASTVRRILVKDLKFHPYKISVCQQLLPGDYRQRVEFAQIMAETLDENEDAILFMSDEAHFHLDGHVNNQNFRYWCAENPQILSERPLHSARVTVWCAIGKVGVIGPYFFEDDGGNAITVNAERYSHMLNTFFFRELRRRRITLRNIWFQQDGATAHTARASMAVVRQKFPGRVISRFGDINWPARSPDLSIPDFFLWGYLKSKVYIGKPRTLPHLKECIRREINEIPREMLVDAIRNFRERLDTCLEENGRHLRDVIFRT